MRGLILLLASITAAPLAAQSVEPPAVTVTEIALVYTGEEEGMRPQVEPWDPAGPTMGNMLSARIDYFLVAPAPIVLENGARFDLSDLEITAYGLNGNVFGGAPLKLSLEAPEGVLSLELALDNQSLFALGPGIARLWVDALLPRGTGEHYRLPVVILVR